jgi:ornithine lipid ester-linked acyl 2-hydroxylase
MVSQVNKFEGRRPTPWYNEFGGRYSGDHPAFYNPETLPWVRTLEDNWQTIRDEMFALMESKPQKLQPYFINRSMSFPPKSWQTMGLYFWKFTMHGNCRSCPQTVRTLKSIPDLVSCSLSLLEPQSNINPHQGDTDAVIRCHLGLSIPGELPECGFQVDMDKRSWQPGKVLLFCDARSHTAWNHTDGRRFVLILDVMRPEFAGQQNSVCARVLASSVVQMVYQEFPSLGRRTGYTKKLIYSISYGMIRILSPIQRSRFWGMLFG